VVNGGSSTPCYVFWGRGAGAGGYFISDPLTVNDLKNYIDARVPLIWAFDTAFDGLLFARTGTHTTKVYHCVDGGWAVDGPWMGRGWNVDGTWMGRGVYIPVYMYPVIVIFS